MFFALDLLLPSHGGRFSSPWIASTRGMGHVKQSQIDSCNIIQLCQELATMIRSTSTIPRKRLALTVSARLTHGMVKIHFMKAEQLLDAVMALLETVLRPIKTRDMSESSPVRRIRAPRKRRTIPAVTPEEPLEPTENMLYGIRLLPPACTTLSPSQMLIDEPREGSLPMSVSSRPSINVVAVEGFGTSVKRKTRAVTRSQLAEPLTVVVEEPVVEEPMVDETAVGDPPRGEEAAVAVAPPMTPTSGIDAHRIRTLVEGIRGPESEHPINKQLMKQKRDGRIDITPEENTARFAEISGDEPVIKPLPALLELPGWDLLENTVPEVQVPPPSPSWATSLVVDADEFAAPPTAFEQIPTLQPPASLSVDELAELRLSRPILAVEPPTPPLLPLPAALPPLRITMSMLLADTDDEEGEVQEQLPVEVPAAHPLPEPPVIHKMSRYERLKQIRKKVKRTDGELEIGDVAQQPLTCANVALALFDLLDLHSTGHVKLINKPDSDRLGKITKGPRLLLTADQ